MTDIPAKTTHAIEIVNILAQQRKDPLTWQIAVLHDTALQTAWETYQRDPMNADARAALVDTFRARFPNELPD